MITWYYQKTKAFTTEKGSSLYEDENSDIWGHVI